jgi:predicted nucleotidyltransferase
LIDKLFNAKLIHPPKWMVGTGSIQYLTMMGSDAYGVSSGGSDLDIYGFCIPPREFTFPHLAGEIAGFGTQKQRFDQWSEHHIPNPDGKDVTYDFALYSIVKYFDLCMVNNPNMIDSLFTPRRCVLHSTAIGEYVRENRKMFLHKGAWHKFKGYAYSQMAKIKNKVNSSNAKRAETIEKFGYDLKFAYHLVRLLSECEQILVEHDLDLERNREQLKSIRRGEWTLEQIESYFTEKEKILEMQYATSTLPHSPDEEAIKTILLHCLEMFYGSISAAISRNPSITEMLNDLKLLVDKYDRA